MSPKQARISRSGDFANTAFIWRVFVGDFPGDSEVLVPHTLVDTHRALPPLERRASPYGAPTPPPLHDGTTPRTKTRSPPTLQAKAAWLPLSGSLARQIAVFSSATPESLRPW
jgi:hypothetical protein